MAPLAPSSTPRFRFYYTVTGTQHSLQLRSTLSPAAIGGYMNNVWTTFATAIFGLTLDFVTFAVSGSDVFNVVTTGYEGNTYGGSAGNQENIPWAYTFIGRTAGGRRCRITQFGAPTLSANYRITPGESTEIDNVIAILVASGSILQGIDSLPIAWKPYADVQVNDHWVKEVRP